MGQAMADPDKTVAPWGQFKKGSSMKTVKESKQSEMQEVTHKKVEILIKPPNMKCAMFVLRGTTPLVMNKFSHKARMQIKSTQQAGSTAKSKKVREPKDFEKNCEEAKHISEEGWCGIPASAFRCAMIGACRIVNFQMTKAKLSVFVEADGYDKDDGTPLVKITKGKPHYSEHTVRNDSGVCDIRARPMWDRGWETNLIVRWDADQFTANDVSNLLARAGMQVGILEGRPSSKDSCGMGWGLFEVLK